MRIFPLAVLIVFAPFAAALGGPLDKSERELADSGWKPEVFKTTGETKLKVWYKAPAGHDASEQAPAIVFFYGGGWKARNLIQFHRQGEHFIKRGMVVFLADYRVSGKYGGTPFDCVEDAKSAVRYIRAHAPRHGIDPDRIAAGGGSAGGHLAAATALLPGLNAEDDPDVSCVPNALVLFNAVYDNSKDGYGIKRFKDRWKEISPMHHIDEGTPPNIVFLGDQDRFIAVSTAEFWQNKMKAVGTRSDLHIYEGRAHGFFNKGEDYEDTLAKTDAFLVSLGFLEAE